MGDKLVKIIVGIPMNGPAPYLGVPKSTVNKIFNSGWTTIPTISGIKWMIKKQSNVLIKEFGRNPLNA